MTTRTHLIADCDSLAYMAGSCDTLMEAIEVLDSTIATMQHITGVKYFEGFVEHWSGKNIFRNHVAVTRPYKGNRAGTIKPPFVKDCKQRLVSKWGVKTCRYVESEDACAIRANEIGLDRVIFASPDKDTRQVPTTFYDYKKQRYEEVTPHQAAYNFWFQMITGDSTDNIPGLPGKGPVNAKKILAGLDAVEMGKAVVDAYRDADKSYAYLTEQGRLLWLLRHRKDLWEPPVTLEEYEAELSA